MRITRIFKKLTVLFHKKQEKEDCGGEKTCKLEELNQIEEEGARSDDELYGPSSVPVSVSRLDWKQFEKFTASIEFCKVEARVSFSDIFAGGFLDFKREIAEISGSEVVPFFERAINGPLRMLFQTETSFCELPLAVEYREKDGHKFAHLMVGCGSPTSIMAKYHFFIRS
ncbi:MAG: hypothetical protein Q7U36_02895 [bacterium]|nr:hypothetical protein [bacterium]